MARLGNNIKLLEKDELMYIVNNFKFEIMGDYIKVDTLVFDRPTLHSADKDFKIYWAKGRSLTINKKVIDLWKNYFPKESLIIIQYAYNILRLGYIDSINEKDINNVLNKMKGE